MHFFVAMWPLAGKTLDALGAPRPVGEVGDPVQIYLLLIRHIGRFKRACWLCLLRAFYDAVLTVMRRTAANASVSETVAFVAVCFTHTICLGA